MEEIIKDLLLAASLCADCFAVSLCASVTMKKVALWDVLKIAVIFAVIQTGLLFIGWAVGDLFASYVYKIAKYIACLLLMYVGGSMIKEAFDECEGHNLNGLKNIFVAGVATSIDALAVGVSASLAGKNFAAMDTLLGGVAFFTALSVLVGMLGGSFLGRKVGKPATIIGGIVLILLGINIPLGIF